MLNGQRVAAIIVAAGASRRMGFDKLSYSFGGKTVLQRSVQALAGHPYVDEVVAAAGAANEQAVRQALAAQEKPWRVVRGGETRAQSVATVSYTHLRGRGGRHVFRSIASSPSLL